MCKLLFVHHGGSRGGAATCLLEVLRRLDRERFDVCVILPCAGPFSRELDRLGIRYRILPIMNFYYCSLAHSFDFSSSTSIRRSIANAWCLVKDAAGNVATLPFVLREERPDTVVVNSATPLLSGLIAWILGYRVVWQVKEILSKERSKMLVGSIGKILSISDRTLVMSEFSERDVRSAGVDRVTVACDGAVDLERFRPGSRLPPDVSLPDDRQLVGFVGQIYRKKGWHIFVQAAMAIAAVCPEAHFVVIGDSSLMGGNIPPGPRDVDLMKDAVESMRLGASFHFLGHRDDVELVLPSLACLAFATIVDETFGRVMTEAMACGVPVIASDIGAVREIVDDEDNGFVYRPGDARALARGVLRLLADPGLRARMKESARRTAEERFDIEKEMPKFEAAYRGASCESSIREVPKRSTAS